MSYKSGSYVAADEDNLLTLNFAAIQSDIGVKNYYLYGEDPRGASIYISMNVAVKGNYISSL